MKQNRPAKHGCSRCADTGYLDLDQSIFCNCARGCWHLLRYLQSMAETHRIQSERYAQNASDVEQAMRAKFGHAPDTKKETTA